MFDNGYPYTNFHQLNLDWILEKLEKLLKIDPDHIYSPENPPPYPVKSFNGREGGIVLTDGDIANLHQNVIYYAPNGENPQDIQQSILDNMYESGYRLIASDYSASASGYTKLWALYNVGTGARVSKFLEISQNPVNSVNGKTGYVIINISDIANLSDQLSRKYSPDNIPPYPMRSFNNRAGDVSLLNADVNALGIMPIVALEGEEDPEKFEQTRLADDYRNNGIRMYAGMYSDALHAYTKVWMIEEYINTDGYGYSVYPISIYSGPAAGLVNSVNGYYGIVVIGIDDIANLKETLENLKTIRVQRNIYADDLNERSYKEDLVTSDMDILSVRVNTPEAMGTDWKFSTSDGKLKLVGKILEQTSIVLYLSKITK